MRDVKMHELVEIISTGEKAFIVYFNEDDPNEDNYMLEIVGKEEFPDYYKRADFKKLQKND